MFKLANVWGPDDMSWEPFYVLPANPSFCSRWKWPPGSRLARATARGSLWKFFEREKIRESRFSHSSTMSMYTSRFEAKSAPISWLRHFLIPTDAESGQNVSTRIYLQWYPLWGFAHIYYLNINYSVWGQLHRHGGHNNEASYNTHSSHDSYEEGGTLQFLLQIR